MTVVTAAIYTRISHDPEGRQAGVDRQEQDCRRMAADRGWVVLEPVYTENDVSASTRSTKRRPVYEQLMRDVEGGGVDVLLAYSTSRLVDRLLAALEEAEQAARTPEERTRLQRARQALASLGRDVLVGAAGSALGGMG